MFPRFVSIHAPAWGATKVLGRALGSRDPCEGSRSPRGVLDPPRGLASSREVSDRDSLEDDCKERGRPASGVLEGPGRGDACLVFGDPEFVRAFRPSREPSLGSTKIRGVKRRDRLPSEGRASAQGRRLDVQPSMSATLTPIAVGTPVTRRPPHRSVRGAPGNRRPYRDWGQSSRHRRLNVQTSTSNARSPFTRKTVSPV